MMKRILSLFLVFVLIFAFSSCGNKDTSSDGNSIDFEYYAKLGKIPECEYAIGDSVAEIKAKFDESQQIENQNEEHAHDIYEILEGERTVMISSATNGYYYIKEKEANGVSYIVSFDGAYGFSQGTLITDIKDALKNQNFKEENANAQNVFFMLGVSGTVIKTEFGKYTLMFVFQDNSLCATALYLTEDWI